MHTNVSYTNKSKEKNFFALCRAFQSNLLIVSAVTERCALQVFLINSLYYALQVDWKEKKNCEQIFHLLPIGLDLSFMGFASI